MSSCSFCREPASESLSVRHFGCGHLTHADCMPSESPNYKLCAQCSGAPQALGATPALQVSMAVAEPRTHDNRDYVLQPGTRRGRGLLGTVASLVSRAPADGPEQLLQQRVPVRDLMRHHGVGLDHLLRAGVTMDDLLRNGYRWSDLMQFEDIAHKGPARARQALTVGLQLSANNLRDYPDALPWAEVKAHTQLPVRSLRLHFPPDGPLECDGDQAWNARDCVGLGLTFDDLRDLGLAYVQQYNDLMDGLGPGEAARAERDLGVTPAKLQALEDLERPPERAPVREPERAPVRVREPERAPVRVREPEPEPERIVHHTPAPKLVAPPSYHARVEQRRGRHGAVF